MPYEQSPDLYCPAEQGKYDEAIADMQMLSNADPSNVEWKLQIAQFYSADKRPRKAIEVANEVLKSSAENAMASRIRGDAYLSIGKHAEAVADRDCRQADPHESDQRGGSPGGPAAIAGPFGR